MTCQHVDVTRACPTCRRYSVEGENGINDYCVLCSMLTMQREAPGPLLWACHHRQDALLEQSDRLRRMQCEVCGEKWLEFDPNRMHVTPAMGIVWIA